MPEWEIIGKPLFSTPEEQGLTHAPLNPNASPLADASWGGMVGSREPKRIFLTEGWGGMVGIPVRLPKGGLGWGSGDGEPNVSKAPNEVLVDNYTFILLM